MDRGVELRGLIWRRLLCQTQRPPVLGFSTPEKFDGERGTQGRQGPAKEKLNILMW